MKTRLNQTKGARNFVVMLMPKCSFRSQAEADRYASLVLAAQSKDIGVGVFQIMGDTALRLVHIYTQEDKAAPEQEVKHG